MNKGDSPFRRRCRGRAATVVVTALPNMAQSSQMLPDAVLDTVLCQQDLPRGKAARATNGLSAVDGSVTNRLRLGLAEGTHPPIRDPSRPP